MSENIEDNSKFMVTQQWYYDEYTGVEYFENYEEAMEAAKEIITSLGDFSEENQEIVLKDLIENGHCYIFYNYISGTIVISEIIKKKE